MASGDVVFEVLAAKVIEDASESDGVTGSNIIIRNSVLRDAANADRKVSVWVRANTAGVALETAFDGAKQYKITITEV